MKWSWNAPEREPEAVEPEAQASGSEIHIAVVAYRFEREGERVGLCWAAAWHAKPRDALGHAIETIDPDAVIVGRTTFRIALVPGVTAIYAASAIEAQRAATPESGAVHESAAPEGGDAQ